ncbi:tetratricopeptide repeat protein, partial [Phormidium sp. CCY1219]|uniref:tetratricopeptide repeat protein n=1 Tax=Phormidium sp. CCY1219 TaxID=2886104 RepID=UPI002D1F7891
MMHRLASSIIVAFSICLFPVTLPLIAQRSVAQTQNAQAEEVQRLLQQAVQQTGRQPQAAIETFEQVLGIARQINAKELEGIALLGIGRNYNDIGRRQDALEFYEQALRIFQQINNRSGEATTLNNIGAVYSDIGQPQ